MYTNLRKREILQSLYEWFPSLNHVVQDRSLTVLFVQFGYIVIVINIFVIYIRYIFVLHYILIYICLRYPYTSYSPQSVNHNIKVKPGSLTW